MRAIIIDDEAHCRDGLSIMLGKYCENIGIIECCSNGAQGLIAIRRHQPDLVFLDIEMPGMNGFEMLEQCEVKDFEVIFTTAYNEYAIQAIRHSALDYLLKPVNKNELISAVERAVKVKPVKPDVRVNELLQLLSMRKEGGKIALPTLEGLMMINPDEIVYCESESAYTKFFMKDKRCITISKVLKDAETLLTGKGFYRVHHSFLINLQHVSKYIRGNGGEIIMIDGKNIPVSRAKRKEFLDKLEKL